MRQFLEEEKYLGPLRLSEGNHLSLLVDGGQCYPAMLAAMAEAKQSVALESYIFANDKTSTRFRDALIACAKRGVDTRLLIDGAGSYPVDQNFFAPLRAAGVAWAVYRPIRLASRFAWLWVRDHRKILVVDEKVAFTGGLNIADGYAPREWGGENWHDVHVRVDGVAARDFLKIFNRTWKRAARRRRGDALAYRHLEAMGVFPAAEQSAPAKVSIERFKTTSPVRLQVLESRLTQRYTVRRAYLRALRRAQTSVRITNAYFIPDRALLRALKRAAKRGVRVQLLLAGRSDLRAVQYASRFLYARLLRWGIEVYEWNKSILHAKCAVIDGLWCTVGSHNLDRRSFRHNLEANVVCVDKGFAAELDALFERDIRFSPRIDKAAWHRRPILEKILERFFYLFRSWF